MGEVRASSVYEDSVVFLKNLNFFVSLVDDALFQFSVSHVGEQSSILMSESNLSFSCLTLLVTCLRRSSSS